MVVVVGDAAGLAASFIVSMLAWPLIVGAVLRASTMPGAVALGIGTVANAAVCFIGAAVAASIVRRNRTLHGLIFGTLCAALAVVPAALSPGSTLFGPEPVGAILSWLGIVLPCVACGTAGGACSSGAADGLRRLTRRVIPRRK